MRAFLSSASNMANVVRLLRRISSSSRHFCGFTRSYSSRYNNSEIKKWNTGLFATFSIALLVGYKYLRPDIVHAKSRKVCKQIVLYIYFFNFLSDIIFCHLWMWICYRSIRRTMKVAFIFKRKKTQITDKHSCSRVYRLLLWYYLWYYSIIISTLISSRIYLPLLNFIVIHVSLIRRRNVTQGVPDFWGYRL